MSQPARPWQITPQQDGTSSNGNQATVEAPLYGLPAPFYPGHPPGGSWAYSGLMNATNFGPAAEGLYRFSELVQMHRWFVDSFFSNTSRLTSRVLAVTAGLNSLPELTVKVLALEIQRAHSFVTQWIEKRNKLTMTVKDAAHLLNSLRTKDRKLSSTTDGELLELGWQELKWRRTKLRFLASLIVVLLADIVLVSFKKGRYRQK